MDIEHLLFIQYNPKYTNTMSNLSFSELRNVVDFINENTHTTTLHAKVKSAVKENSYSDYQQMSDSVENGYLSIEEWLGNDYFENNGSFYSHDDYCITRDGDVERKDDCNFCDYYEEYTTQEVSQVYIRRQTHNYCQDAIDGMDLFEYRNDYYDSDALAYNDLCEIDGYIYQQDDCYFYNGEWNTEPEEEDEKFVRSYHYNEEPRFIKFSENPEYFIGFEIEKEDLSVKESITIGDFEDKFPKWRKEEDASISKEEGYELVTPAFELNVEEIEKLIKKDSVLTNHINAKFTEACGGHLNISKSNTSGMDFFRSIEGYTPLIYALYSKRLTINFCKGKSNNDLKNHREKHQAINIKSNYVEYRIFSAVRNVETLVWRTKLMKAIVDNPTSCLKEAFLNANSVLRPILSEQYSTPERFDRLLKRLVKYTITYEGINPTEDSNPTEE